MSGLLSDPWFYAAAIPAVILVGLSKGGFGGAVGFVGVPLMALTMPPVQAAARTAGHDRPRFQPGAQRAETPMAGCTRIQPGMV